MSGLSTFLTLAAILLLRIGLPLAVTAGVIYLLHRLDQRWQREALSVPVVAQSVKPCWEVKECPEEKRKTCPASAQSRIPCWQFFRSKSGALRESCLGCEVFRQAPVPVTA